MTLDLQPTLRGELVELRPLREADWVELYAVASDPLLWEQHPERLRYEEAVFARFFREALASRSAFAVIDLATHSIIGSSRFHGYIAGAREVEIGWSFLARSYWGGRFNGEMKALMLAHAFTSVERVIFSVGAHNHRSQRAVERVGGVRLDTHPGIGPETVVFAIDKANWQQR